MANRTTALPRLTNNMLREYAAANPSKAHHADRALRGCRSTRHEIAYEIGADAFEAPQYTTCSTPVY